MGETLQDQRKYFKRLFNDETNKFSLKTKFLPEPCMHHVNMEAKEPAERGVAAPSVTVTSLERTRRGPSAPGAAIVAEGPTELLSCSCQGSPIPHTRQT